MAAPLVGGSASSSAATGVTRPAYRHAVQGEIGHFRATTATTDADEPGLLIIPALRADRVPMTRLDGHYLYAPSLDEARQVVEGSYDGATWSVWIDAPFSSDLANATIEITNTLPGTYHLDRKGANQIVNEALALLPVWARIDLTGDGTMTQSLNGYDGLAENDISHIEDSRSGVAGDPSLYSPWGFSIQQNGADRTLVTEWTYGTADTFTLVAVRPGDRWIKSGGVWGDGSGLQAEDAEAAAPLHWVKVWGAVLALGYLIDVTEEDESLSEERRARRIARYRTKLASYARPIQHIKEQQLPRLENRRAAALLGEETCRDAFSERWGWGY